MPYLHFCVCLLVVVSNTLCVVFLFCFSSSCVPYVAISLDCPFLIALSVFSSETFIYNIKCTTVSSHTRMNNQ